MWESWLYNVFTPHLPSDVSDRLYHLPDPTHDPTNENHYKSLAILVALKQPKFLCVM